MSLKTIKETQLAQRHWTRYVNSLVRGHHKYQKQAKNTEAFYLGGGRHWAQDTKDRLEALGKPWLEENIIFSTVNAVLGVQTQSRMDISYKPRETGDQIVSDTLTKVGMFLLDQNKFPWVESQVFADGIIQQRGFFDIRMDFSNNIFGEVKIKDLDPLDVIPDPDSNSYDPDDWNDVMITSWIPLDSIESIYGRKKFLSVTNGFQNRINATGSFGDDGFGEPRNRFGDELNFNSYYLDETGAEHVKVIDRQHYQLQNRRFFVDTIGDLIPVPDDFSDREAKRFAKENEYEIIKKVVRRIRWTISTEDTVLHDDWSPYDHFTVVPYFPYFRRGVTVGLVDNLVKTQEMINKVFSQVLHTVNTTSNSGWSVEEGSLTNMDTEDLEDLGAQSGLIIEYRRGSTKPEKIEPNQIPTGLDKLITTGVELIRMISGVSETFQGAKSNEISGVAIQNKVQQTAVQLAVPIDNLFRTRNLIATRLLKLIQQFYTNERTFIIVTPEVDEENEEVTINQFDSETGELLNDVTVGKYDVVIADVPTQITFENAQFAQAIEMRKFGINIPDEEMIRMSTLSRKNEIIKKITSAEPSPTEQEAARLQLAQLQKTVEKLDSEAESKSSENLKKVADVALLIKQNPGLSDIIDKLLEQQEEDKEEDLEEITQTNEEEPALLQEAR